MQKPLILSILFALCTKLWADDYAHSVAVVVTNDCYQKTEWKKVVDTLVAKHNATLIIDSQGDDGLKELKQVFPKYTCFVTEPENSGFDQVLRLHRAMRKLDGDPYTDTIWGIITGYTPKDALRMARATEPRIVSDALLTAGMGPERWRNARFISTSTPGEYGAKHADGTLERHNEGQTSQIERWVGYWNELDPDAVISSAHASQRNLEMPFGQGHLHCENGRLYGAGENRAYPLNTPQTPKLYFAVGNCLIGDIPDRNAMALAWMGFGQANQMLGYTVETWYGKGGWGTLKLWEQGAGIMPLNEAAYFNNVWLVEQLRRINPALAGLDAPIASRDLKMNTLLSSIHQHQPQARHYGQEYGLLYDRDTLAFYGDPTLEIRLDAAYTIPALYEANLAYKNGTWIATVHMRESESNETADLAPIGIFFPKRLKNFRLKTGEAHKPLFTDNHLLITNPGPYRPGETFEITFEAEPIR